MVVASPKTPVPPNQTQNQPTTTKSSATISQTEITSILSACTNNFRFDGRSNLHIRPYTLLKSTTTNTATATATATEGLTSTPSKEVTPILSNGSSRLSLPGSNTDIICSIKADVVHPPQYQIKNEGLIELNLDILPFASNSSSMDRRDIRKEEMEVTSTLMRLLIPFLVDKEQLVILKGRYVWRLYIDVLVMHCDGNLMDVCSMAIWGAMQNVKLPHVVPVVAFDKDGGGGTSTAKGGKKASDELMLDGDIANAVVPNGVPDCPIVVTVCLLPKNESGLNGGNTNTNLTTERMVSKGIGSVMVVDATRQEEACASTKVSVSVDVKGNICGVHKYGNSSVVLNSCGEDSALGTVPFSTLSQVQDTAIAVSKSVFDLMKVDSLETKSVGIANNFFRGHFELQ